MSNILLEQYSLVKRDLLKRSPFMCLNNKKIEKNPHQIDAFLKAISSIKTGGMIFADEVGLGKTIEAGLVLKYLIKSGRMNILIATPASLRVQWQEELRDKFKIESEVLDNYQLKDRERLAYLRKTINETKGSHVVLVSYGFASKFMTHRDFNNIKWDLVVIDEAHNMRNVFNGAKYAKRLYEASMNIPKLLLTATPLQNSLDDLFGLVSFIDPRIFEDKKLFDKKFVQEQRYDELKSELSHVLTRTLRKEVAKDMKFAKRTCMRFDFELSDDEKYLYMLVDKYVKNTRYGFPNQNKNLCILMIRKLLASSSFALIETFEKIKIRLEKLLEGTRQMSADLALDFLFQMLDSEEQEEWEIDESDENDQYEKELIESEINMVNQIIIMAEKIKYNTKMTKLIEAVDIALKKQREKNINEKVVIFTESLRTQKYIYDSLLSEGYDSDDIVIFNGNQNDPHSKEIFKAWRALNSTNNNPLSVQFKHAMVDYFARNGKIFISTDSGAEGLNLQFCNTIINYDLPWNPQRIEQRIGRVHRYGQLNDVVAINFLNTGNEADKRVYEILSKKFQLFEGVFGASDESLGLLAGEMNFEKTILDIYQKCNKVSDYKIEFDQLNRRIDSKRQKVNSSLKSILQVISTEDKIKELKQIKRELINFFNQISYWHDYLNEEIDNLSFEKYRLDYNPFEIIGLGHGYLFVGGLVQSNNYISPVLLVTDEKGGVISLHEDEIISVLEKIGDEDIKRLILGKDEELLLQNIYNNVTGSAIYEHEKKVQPIKDYNSRKIDNWAENKKQLLDLEIEQQAKIIAEMKEYASTIRNFMEKVDYLKSVKGQETKLSNLRENYFERKNKIDEEAKKEKIEFNKQFDIEPTFLAKVILKF